ncbi:MAG: riboflavin biosynthesis protein RibF [Planctomycetes bacterium]|nr:riboflavin biosynthesis protein RibF [Planctomycetota bacterium]
MELYRSFDRVDPPDARGRVVTLGVFDGVHLGHREVLARTITWAREIGARSAAITFDPHPAVVLGRSAPLRILPAESRVELFGELGIEEVFLVEFDTRLADTPAEEFVQQVLLERLGVRGVVLGYDTRLGKGAAGDGEFLRRLGERMGFGVRIVEPVLVGGKPVKSTRVRDAIRSGDLALATELLGRPPAAIGRVVAGAGRGRRIGHPTANVDLEHDCLPPVGVYATRVRLGTFSGRPREAVTNVGRRPTFDGEDSPVSVECHLLDFAGDLYGERLVVEFLDRIRGERKFSGPEELAAQIARDAAWWSSRRRSRDG